MSLKNKLLKSGSGISTMLEDSDIFSEKGFVSTEIPVLDLALSGEIGKGLTRGITIVAGPSRHFKSLLCLIMVSKYMKAHPDAICIFYDSEYGTTPDYFKSVGIDTDRIIHTPIATLEEMRNDMTQKMDAIDKGEKVIFFVDSIGNVASKKEVEDAKSDKDSADMTRAKVIKSITRIASGYVNTKDLRMVIVGHTYETMEMYSKQKLSGGTGIFYNAQNIIFVGRRQNKKDKELLGYEFVLNVEKSRFVKEGTQLPFKVTFEEGVYRFSGLLDVALEGGYIIKPKNGWYTRPCVEGDKSFREKEVDMSDEFWAPIFAETDFADFAKRKFQLETVIFKEELDDDKNHEEDRSEEEND